MKKVLLTYGYYKSGHYSAVLALEEELARRNIAFETINLFTKKSGLFDKLFTIYRAFAAEKVKSVPSFLIAEQFLDLLVKETPFENDLGSYAGAISTHPYSAAVLAYQKKVQQNDLPLVSVHTDYTPFPIIAHPSINYYTGAVAREEVESSIRKRCFETGIPVRISFHNHHESKKDKIIFLAGADGFGELEQMATLAAEIPPNFEKIIICGRNKQAYHSLREKYPQLTVKGYANDLPQHFQQAMMVVTKGGGLTITEALNTECIPVFVPPLLFWEDEAAKYIASRGAGFCLPDFGPTSVKTLTAILHSVELREGMRERCGNLAKPDAAKDIVDLLLSGKSFGVSQKPIPQTIFGRMEAYRLFFGKTTETESSELARYLFREVNFWLKKHRPERVVGTENIKR